MVFPVSMINQAWFILFHIVDGGGCYVICQNIETSLRTLKFGGNEVTDRGVYWMLGGETLSEDDLPCPVRFRSEGEGRQERNPLCLTLNHLDMSRALMVSEEAVSQCWKTCSNLVNFNMQESHLWLLLKKIKKAENWSKFVIPLKRLEITTHCTQVHTTLHNNNPLYQGTL